jgi:hypothetical protein
MLTNTFKQTGKQAFFFLFVFSYSHTAFCQNIHDQSFQVNHFAFKLSPNFYNKQRVVGEQNPNRVYSTIQFGGEVGVDYYFNKLKNKSIIIGLNFGFSPRIFGYEIPLQYLNNPPINSTTTISRSYFNMNELFYLSLPVTFEKRWPNKTSFNFIQLGAALKYALIFSSDVTSLSSPSSMGLIRLIEVREDWKENSKPIFHLHTGFGKGYFLKNNNILKLSLVASVATQSFIKADYKFTVPNQPTQEGTYATNGSFIGVSISYVLTGSNSRFVQSLLKKK